MNYLCADASNFMKSIKYITMLTFTAILLIISLQGIWISNVYKLTEIQIHTLVNEILSASINKELMLRRSSILNSTTNEIIGTVEIDDKRGIFEGPELVYQEFLLY